MLGSDEKRQLVTETKPLIKMRKSPVLNKNKKKGEVVTIEDIVLKSPGLGINPYEIEKVIGKKINKDLNIDDYINFED